MQSVAITVVVALMILRIAALSPTETTTETTTLTTTVNCPIYTCRYNCVYVTGPDGCQICDCGPTCWDVECGPYETCIMREVDCGNLYCFDEPICVQNETTTVATIGSTSTTFCPDMSGCTGTCQVVNSSRPDGCPDCLCVDPICGWLVICGTDEDCVPSDEALYRYTCVPKYATTTPCPMIKCAPDCVPDTGSDGCPTCACPPSCQTVKCSAGYECQLVNATTCIGYPCFPQPQCVPIAETTTKRMCRMFMCIRTCVLGPGPDGCPICHCPPTCETVNCSAGYECQLVNATCSQNPCFPQPQCVSINGTAPPASTTPTTTPVAATDPCTGTPNAGRCSNSFIRRWTYNTATDKCEKFRYYGCTPSPNTFSSRKACRNRCKAACTAVVCKDNCYTFTKKNGCTKCVCPNPCKSLVPHRTRVTNGACTV